MPEAPLQPMKRLIPTPLDEIRWIELPSHEETRGVLTVVEGARDLPFQIRRVYLLHHLSGERGGHAHKRTRQLIIPASGTCALDLFDGAETRTYHFNDPRRGLLLGPMVFIRLYDFSPGATVVVLASTHYNHAHTIRSRHEYLQAIGKA